MLIIFMESSNWWPENIRCSLWRCYALTYSGHVWFANRFAGHVLLIISHHNTWLPLMRNFVQLSRHYISTQALEGAAFRALSHAICKCVSTTIRLFRICLTELIRWLFRYIWASVSNNFPFISPKPHLELIYGTRDIDEKLSWPLHTLLNNY